MSKRKQTSVESGEGPSAKAAKMSFRRVVCPPNRRTPLKNSWKDICKILVEELKVQARVNTKGQPWTVDVRSESHANVEKAVNLLDAFFKGFDLGDAEAIVRVDGLYIETFRVQDVKSSLKGDHMARAVGRLAGYNGRTKFAIENSTKTRIVIADQTVHILGSYNNLALARRALCDLILGAQPNKVFGRMRSLSARANAAF